MPGANISNQLDAARRAPADARSVDEIRQIKLQWRAVRSET